MNEVEVLISQLKAWSPGKDPEPLIGWAIIVLQNILDDVQELEIEAEFLKSELNTAVGAYEARGGVWERARTTDEIWDRRHDAEQ